MVDHDGQVPLALAVTDLVDPDPPQPVKQIDLALGLAGDPFDDRADGPPRDPLNSATAVFDVLTASHAT